MNLPSLKSLAALLVLAIAAQAQTTTPAPVAAVSPADPSSSWTLTPAYVSQYMFRGAHIAGPSFEPALEYDAGNLALGVWSNMPLKDRVLNQPSLEFDWYGSYTVALTDNLSLVPGATAYTYPNAQRGEGSYAATFEPNLALSYTLLGLTVTPKVYYDMVLKGATYEATATYSIPLKRLGTKVNLTFTEGTFKLNNAVANSTPGVKNWGNYYLVGAALPFQLTPTTQLSIGLAYTKGWDNLTKVGAAPQETNLDALGHRVVTVSYTINL